MKPEQSNQKGSDLPPGLAQPARRALAGAGYTRLEQFTRVTEAELLQLHGMGPKALKAIRKALQARGLAFAEPRPQGVDEYIASAPAKWRPRLTALRKAIRAAVPGAQERISYRMPFYEYKGRLVYFALQRQHIGLYALTAPVLAQHKSELAGYVMSKGTIRFPLDERLPVGLIKQLVKAQAKRNAEAERKK
jgi:uncharacterized protein YdhG (YjbR/CyaY superfamily)